MARLVKNAFGMELLPWQRQVVDVALEVDPATGLLVYREVDLTVPRQSGKSTLILGLALHRAFETSFFGPRQRMVYTAQTGKDARKKWEEDYLEFLDSSKALVEDKHYRISRASGHEGIFFPASRSRFGLAATTKKSGHGGTLDEGFIDEAFAQVDERLEQAFKPAMVTRKNAQLWVVSTAGDESSVYLRKKVQKGRELVANGVDRGVAYFEWSAPEDADPEDRSVWWGCMPALGLTASIEAVEADFATMDRGEFCRAYLNQWVDGRGDPPVLDPLMWADLTERDPRRAFAQLDGQLAYGLDVTVDRGRAALAVAGYRAGDQLPQIEVTDHRPGTAWVVERLLDMQERHGRARVALDGRGPAGSLIPELEDAGIQYEILGAPDMARACGSFYDNFQVGTLRHTGQPELAAAVAGSRKRALSDSWAWDRRDPSVDISPLVAATLALWCLTAHPYREITESVW